MGLDARHWKDGGGVSFFSKPMLGKGRMKKKKKENKRSEHALGVGKGRTSSRWNPY